MRKYLSVKPYASRRGKEHTRGVVTSSVLMTEPSVKVSRSPTWGTARARGKHTEEIEHRDPVQPEDTEHVSQSPKSPTANTDHSIPLQIFRCWNLGICLLRFNKHNARDPGTKRSHVQIRFPRSRWRKGKDLVNRYSEETSWWDYRQTVRETQSQGWNRKPSVRELGSYGACLAA